MYAVAVSVCVYWAPCIQQVICIIYCDSVSCKWHFLLTFALCPSLLTIANRISCRRRRAVTCTLNGWNTGRHLMVNDKKVENLCFVRNSFYLRHSIRQCRSICCTSRVICDCAFINVLLIGRELVLCSAGIYLSSITFNYS